MVDARAPRDPLEQLKADITRLYELVADLGRANPLESASIERGGLVIGGGGAVRSRDFDGTGPLDPGLLGWWLGGEDAGAVFNQLALRNGIVGNDALSDPIRVGHISSLQNGFATGTADVAYAPQVLTVPDGFTRALVHITVYVGAYNDTASFDYLYIQARIDGVDSREVPVPTDSLRFGGASTAKATLLTDLVPGSTFAVAAAAHSQNAGWAANATNRAATEGVAIYLR